MNRRLNVFLAVLLPIFSSVATAMEPAQESVVALLNFPGLGDRFLDAVWDGKQGLVTEILAEYKALYPEYIPDLLAYGSRLSHVYGSTALHCAALNNRLAIIDILLRHHAVVNSVDVEGRTPIYRAAERGYVQAVEKLARAGANMGCLFSESCSNSYDDLPLRMIKMPGLEERVRKMVENSLLAERWRRVNCLAKLRFQNVLLMAKLDEDIWRAQEPDFECSGVMDSACLQLDPMEYGGECLCLDDTHAATAPVVSVVSAEGEMCEGIYLDDSRPDLDGCVWGEMS